MTSEDLASEEWPPAYAEGGHDYSQTPLVVEAAEVAERFPRVKDWLVIMVIMVIMAVLVVPDIVLDALVGYVLYRPFSAVF